ncbi:MAG: hypothetical protein B7Z73_17660, partial [Planctomycetia bacterium 21-64-5]
TLLAVHLSQVYRHGLASGTLADSPRARPYWPYQSVRNATVVAAVVAIVAWLAWQRGAPLDAPADTEIAVLPRPEWYFRWLFELRRYFTGEWEFVATLVVPLAVLAFFLAIPFLDQGCGRRVGTALRWLVVIAGIAAWDWLTWASLARDANDPEYQEAQVQAAELADHARQLADENGIPPEGASALLRDDPETQGPLIFERHCASCHSHSGPDGKGFVAAESSAPDLVGFGSTQWTAGLLGPDAVASPRYFGRTSFAEGEMVGAVRDLHAEASQELPGQLRAVAMALAAEASPAAAGSQAEVVEQGRQLIVGKLGCTDCHKFHDEGELGSAPDLTGYGSREWLEEFIRNPRDERFYGDRNDRMPAFADRSVSSEHHLLTDREVRLLVDWVRAM